MSARQSGSKSDDYYRGQDFSRQDAEKSRPVDFIEPFLRRKRGLLMASNKEKLSKFNQAINHYAEEQRRKIENEVADYKRRQLDEAEREVLTEAYRLIQKEMAEVRNNITREMAHREMDARRELLAKRRSIMEDVFEGVRQRLLEFTATDRYAGLLEKDAAEIAAALRAGDGDAVLFLRPEDMKYQERVAKAFGHACEIRADSGIRIGGIRAVNNAAGLTADATLDASLEEQRVWFEENSGLAVV